MIKYLILLNIIFFLFINSALSCINNINSEYLDSLTKTNITYNEIDSDSNNCNCDINSLSFLSGRDSINNSENIDTVQSLRINQNEFTYSDNLRYTINGDLPLIENDLDPLKFGVFAASFTGFIIGQHIYQVNTIWSKTSGFKFIEDGNYALYADKVGHFYGAYLGGYTYSEMFMWSGLSYKNATLAGSLLGLAYSTYVEIMDGYADNWGFSPSDFYSDVAGFGFFYLQQTVPWFQNITPKFMYIPSEWHGEHSRVNSEFFIDDYSSQTFYFTFNIYNILPDDYKQYWLPWLQLTVGYAARNLSQPSVSGYNPDNATKYSDLVAGSPKFIIGLDYDFVKLLPDGIPIWNWLRQSLNFMKLPAPAIEFSEQGTRFMLMYPFLKL
jgi:hypothetical protein